MSTVLTPRYFTLVLCAFLLGIFAVFAAPLSVAAQNKIDLNNELPLQGFAWSGYTASDGNTVGVGWISMSCASAGSCNGSSDDYGVVVRSGGMLEGYAWSPHIGWIKFGNLSGFPGGGQNARLAADGGLRGWARACAATDGGDCGSMNNAPSTTIDGWDGWISLRGSNYGVKFSTTKDAEDKYPISTGSGDSYAWGGPRVMGWLDFSGVALGGTPTPPLAAPTLTATDCVIAVSASSCDANIQWNGPGFSNPRVQLNRGIGDLSSVGMTGSRNVSLSGDNSSYQVRLRDGGTVELTDTINVSCEAGSSWDSVAGICQSNATAKPDLTVDPASADEGVYNKETGEYENVDFKFMINNEGATTTAYDGVTTFRWDIDYDETVWPSSGSEFGSISPPITDGSSRQVSANVGTLRFGIYDLTAEVDRPDPDDDIDEELEGNNSNSSTVTLSPQDPEMDLSVSSQIVRSGDIATITWDTVATYPMNCTLSGPGIATQTFNPATAGPTGSIDTSERYNTSIYLLSCEVDYPGIDATYSASTQVEVIPRLEEI